MYRIGTGFDVHAFKPGKKIVLCGIEIPFDKSLAGHSDADVALHSLTDAILGALALGDIGLHFPDSDTKWKGADSIIFLSWSLERAKQMNFKLANIDLTIICENSKNNTGPAICLVSLFLRKFNYKNNIIVAPTDQKISSQNLIKSIK